MRAAIARHDALVRAAAESAAATCSRPVGDAFWVAFADPVAAVDAAVAIQHAVTAEEWPRDNTGAGADRDAHGSVRRTRRRLLRSSRVNRVARLEAIAHGGQTLVSANDGGPRRRSAARRRRARRPRPPSAQGPRPARAGVAARRRRARERLPGVAVTEQSEAPDQHSDPDDQLPRARPRGHRAPRAPRVRAVGHDRRTGRRRQDPARPARGRRAARRLR